MGLIATDRVAWIVGLSRSWALQKRQNRSRCRFGCGLNWAQWTTYYLGSRSANNNWHFWGGGRLIV